MTSNPSRLQPSLSAETNISTLHQNDPTVTLGGNRLTSLPSSLHTWRKQTCQLCAKTVSTHPAETDIVNFVPSGKKWDDQPLPAHSAETDIVNTVSAGSDQGPRIAQPYFFNKFLFKIAVFRCGSGSASGRQLRNLNFSINSF